MENNTILNIEWFPNDLSNESISEIFENAVVNAALLEKKRTGNTFIVHVDPENIDRVYQHFMEVIKYFTVPKEGEETSKILSLQFQGNNLLFPQIATRVV